MANKTLNARFQQKTDTSSNWTLNNPTLLLGEIGIESDTNKFKIGNGLNPWNLLSYAVGDATGLKSYNTNSVDDAIKSGDIKDGDVFIIDDDFDLPQDIPTMTNDEWEIWRNSSNYDAEMLVAITDDEDGLIDDSAIIYGEDGTITDLDLDDLQMDKTFSQCGIFGILQVILTRFITNIQSLLDNFITKEEATQEITDSISTANDTLEKSLITEINKKMNTSGGAFTGTVTAASTTPTTKAIRNITISTASPSGGSNGDIWIVYTA